LFRSTGRPPFRRKAGHRPAAAPGIDVIFAASVNPGDFSGRKQTDPEYEALVNRIHDVTLQHGVRPGGPQAWKDRPGLRFSRGLRETQSIRLGAKANLGN
jgi:hypothetical protein